MCNCSLHAPAPELPPGGGMVFAALLALPGLILPLLLWLSGAGLIPVLMAYFGLPALLLAVLFVSDGQPHSSCRPRKTGNPHPCPSR